MTEWHKQTHHGIQTLTPYRPGKSVQDLYRERGISDAVKLASNENPLGCSDKVIAALANLSKDFFATYPGPFHHPLKAKIAERLSLAPEQIVLSNGSDALFTLIFTLFCLHQNKHVLTHQQCFPSYPIQATGFGIPIKQIPLSEDWQWTPSAFIEACSQDTGVIIFANPNNPTGVKCSQSAIIEVLENIPEHIIVVVDEAYYEYACSDSTDSALPLLKHHRNLIITRSFSKAYGLANLRLGYAIADEAIIELIWRIQQPFAVNGMALYCGEIAWEDQAFVKKSIAINAEGLQQMKAGIEAQGYQCIPSQTNFITMDAGEQANSLNEHLLDNGVIIRPLAPSGMPNHLRVSIGTQQQNERFLNALEAFTTRRD